MVGYGANSIIINRYISGSSRANITMSFSGHLNSRVERGDAHKSYGCLVPTS